jgi:hypothetical protein
VHDVEVFVVMPDDAGARHVCANCRPAAIASTVKAIRSRRWKSPP